MTPPAPFDVAFMQVALAELLLLAGVSGVLGPWIVLRRLAFFSHAAGTASFPGLVLAAAWGVPAAPVALVCALGYAGVVERFSRRAAHDAATGLLLVAALAVGAILASDVARSGAGVDTLLFGTLVGLGTQELLVTAAVLVVAVAMNAALGRAWLARGFDPAGAGALGVRTAGPDRTLLALVAAAVVATLPAVGALLVSVLLVAPAATVRLLTEELSVLRRATAALAAAEGVLALWLADRLDVGTGPALAVVAGATFVAVSASCVLRAPRPVPA